MSSNSESSTHSGQCAFAEVGCLQNFTQISDTLCYQCAYTPLKNIWNKIKERDDLVKKKEEAVTRCMRNEGRSWACVMLSREHLRKPWVDKIIEAKIAYEIWEFGKEENDETREEVRRTLMCLPVPRPNMLCGPCTWAARKFGSRECKDAFSRLAKHNDVLKESCNDALEESGMVVQNDGLRRII